MRTPLLLGLLPLIGALAGCPGTVTTDGIDGFTVRSAHWLVLVQGTTRTHALVAGSVEGYCGKRQNAEAKRQEAFDQHQERLAASASICESLDVFYDEIARAYNPLDKPDASYVTLVLARDVDSQDLDAITAPAAGHYQQLGGNSDGSFTGNVAYHEARWNQQWADAWTCEDLTEEELEDPIAISGLIAETTAEVDFPTTYSLSAAELDIEETSDDVRDVTVDGDILEGTTTIGGFQATFNASKCEVELSDHLDL